MKMAKSLVKKVQCESVGYGRIPL